MISIVMTVAVLVVFAMILRSVYLIGYYRGGAEAYEEAKRKLDDDAS